MSGFAEEPRASYSARMGKAEFFAWLATKEGGRYELKDGEIVVHAGSSRRHAWLAMDFGRVLLERLDRSKWAVGGSDAAVEIGDNIRYPDVVVEARIDDGASPSTSTPVLIIEILSSSSGSRDFHEKLAEYTTLPSLEAYIVASQDATAVWVWQRDRLTREFPIQPVEIAGSRRSITIDVLGISLPLDDMYRGIIGN